MSFTLLLPLLTMYTIALLKEEIVRYQPLGRRVVESFQTKRIYDSKALFNLAFSFYYYILFFSNNYINIVSTNLLTESIKVDIKD